MLDVERVNYMKDNKEIHDITSFSFPYINSLTDLIKSEYETGKIQSSHYHKMIDLLTIVKLQFETINNVTSKNIRKGVIVDVSY